MRAAALSAVVLSFVVAVPAVSGAPCDAADRMLGGARYAEAQALYVEVLKLDKSQPCARTGLETLAAIRAEGARHLDLAKQYSLAGDKAAATREKLEAARFGVVEPPSAAKTEPSKDGVAAAQWLAKAGLHDAAVDALKKSIDPAPPAKELPADLRYLTDHPKYYLAKRYGKELSLAAFALLLGVLFISRRVIRPRLKLGTIEGVGEPGGRSMVVYLQQQLLSLTKAQGTIKFVAAPLADVNVPAAISTAAPSTLEWVKPLLALLANVDWRSCLTMTGSVHAATDRRGAGLTVVLSRGNRIVSTTTLWQSAYGIAEPADISEAASKPADADDPSPYLQLAEPAAVWLLFQLLQETNVDQAEIKRGLGTLRWTSYALNAVAVRAASVSKSRARALLIDALMIDPENAAARANLGMLLQESAGRNEQLLRAALDQLTAARRCQLSSDSTDPVFLTASYHAAYVHYALYTLRRDRKDLEAASAELKMLVQNMNERRDGTSSERVRNFIAGAMGMVDVMRIGVEADLGALTPSEAHLQLMKYRDHPTDETQYNLACTYSVLAKLTASAADRVAFVQNAMSHLKLALHLDPAHYMQAIEDSSLDTLREARRAEFAAVIDEAKEAAEKKKAKARAVVEVAAEAPAKTTERRDDPPPPPPPSSVVTSPVMGTA